MLVEGESDRIAVETLARRRGLNLPADGVEVIVTGGAQAVGRVAAQWKEIRVAGLYDRAEEAVVLAGAERAGVDPAAFFACDPDLEGELARALGPERMLALVEERGQLGQFRTFQKQVEKRSLPLDVQLHGWLHNWKVRYAAALVDALDLERVPAPLDAVLEYVRPSGRASGGRR